MPVVPALSEGEEGDPAEVGGPVARVEGAVAEAVGEGVHRPGHMVDHRVADEARPEERRPEAGPGPGQQAAQRRGQQERGRRDERVGGVQPPDVRVGQKVGHPVRAAGAVALGVEPAHLGVQQPPEQAEAVLAVRPGRVRVAGPVGVLVVAPVLGDPQRHRPLERQAARDGQGEADRPDALERPVGEQAVVADADPEDVDRVQGQGERQVERADPPSPEHVHRGAEHEERQHDEHHQVRVPAGPRDGDRPACVGRGWVGHRASRGCGRDSIRSGRRDGR